MNNTTMHLWEVKGFDSSSVKALFVGQTANGQDCIGCAWDSYTTYVYAYDGIIDTFMFYLDTFKSVGKAMASTKLRNGMEQGIYSTPCPSTAPRQNQLYRFGRYDMKRNIANLTVHEDLVFETPENAIKVLVNDEVLSAEESQLVTCLKTRVTA